MGRRYFCEYCNKSFLDDLPARKKHINGTMHKRMKKEHYDAFRDAATILAEESAKVPCKRFRQTGECSFGNGCCYSHYSPHDLAALRRHVEEQNPGPSLHDDAPQLSTWLQKRSSLPRPQEGTTSQERVPVWSPNIPNLPPTCELPPSLRPAYAEDFSGLVFEDWG